MKRLGEILVENGIVTRKQLEEAVESQVIFGGKIGTNLVELGYISVNTLSVFLSLQHGVQLPPYSQIEDIPSEVISLIPKEMAKKHRVIPFKKENKTLHLIMEEPENLDAIDEISFLTGLKVKPYILPEILIRYLLERYYGIKRETRYILLTKREREEYLKPHAEKVEEVPDKKEMLKTQELLSQEDFEKLYMQKPVPDVEEEIEVEIEEEFSPISLKEARALLDKIKNRDELGETVLKLAMNRFKRSCLFVLMKDKLIGWDGIGEGVNRQRFRRFVKNIDEMGTFRFVLQTKSHFVGKLSGISAEFFEVIGGEPVTAFIIPVLFRGRVVNIFYGDGGKGTHSPTDVADLLIFFTGLAPAYERMIKERKVKI
jgi:hypothetical protein